MSEFDVHRRDSLRSVLALALPGAATAIPAVAIPAVAKAQPSAADTQVLVAYLSRSGNTRVVAGQIARAHHAEVFEIQPAQAYPTDYVQMVEQARRESDAAFAPPLNALVSRIAPYRVVCLGFPIWGMTLPPPVRSFLSSHDLTDKTIVPFITHGGYGTGQSLSVLATLAPRSRIAEAFVLKSDQERDTLASVTQWLKRQPLSDKKSI